MANITVGTSEWTIWSFLDQQTDITEFVGTVYVLVKNYDSGKVIYLRRNMTVTSSNGYPIEYNGSIVLPYDSLNEYHIISDSASTDVRVLPTKS